MAAGEEQWQIFPEETKLQTSVDQGPLGRIVQNVQRLSTALQRILKVEIEEEIGRQNKRRGEAEVCLGWAEARICPITVTIMKGNSTFWRTFGSRKTTDDDVRGLVICTCSPPPGSSRGSDRPPWRGSTSAPCSRPRSATGSSPRTAPSCTPRRTPPCKHCVKVAAKFRGTQYLEKVALAKIL